MNISVAVKDFLMYCQERKCLSSKTTYAYSIDLNQFCVHSSNMFRKRPLKNIYPICIESISPKPSNERLQR